MVSQSRRAESRRGAIQLGVCYDDGEGVAKDQAEAVKWYRKAAEQNDAAAQYNLGVCYAKGARRGEGSGRGGEVVSQSRRAESTPRLNTIWVSATPRAKAWRRIEVEAVKWYRKAAEQNYAKAQYNLGRLLRQWRKAWRRMRWRR